MAVLPHNVDAGRLCRNRDGSGRSANALKMRILRVSHLDCWVRVRAVQTMLALSEADLRIRRRRRRGAEVDQPEPIRLTDAERRRLIEKIVTEAGYVDDEDGDDGE